MSSFDSNESVTTTPEAMRELQKIFAQNENKILNKKTELENSESKKGATEYIKKLKVLYNLGLSSDKEFSKIYKQFQEFAKIEKNFIKEKEDKIKREQEKQKEQEEKKTLEKQKIIEKIEQQPKQELKKIFTLKLSILKNENIPDAQNAIRALLSEKTRLENFRNNNEISDEVYKKYQNNIDIHIQDYAILLLSKTNETNITETFVNTYFSNLGINIPPKNREKIAEILSKNTTITSVAELREKIKNKTLFRKEPIYGRDENGNKTNKVLFYYSPLVIVNLKNGEKIPELLAPKIEEARKSIVDDKGEIIPTKIHLIQEREKQSREIVKENKDIIIDALQEYKERGGTIPILKTGKFQINSESTDDEFRTNITFGKIGNYFKGMKGVHCAEFVAKYLNSKLNLPAGRVIAGDAWTMIENLLKGGLIKEITAKNNKYKIEKANYNSLYTSHLSEHYQKIKQAFEDSNIPIILGVHFLRTATDRPNGLLTRAKQDYKNKTKDRFGNIKVQYKPTANSHVFALENNFSRNTQARNSPLKNILTDLWNSNRHINAEGKGVKLDINSPLIADLKISYTDETGNIVEKPVKEIGLNTKLSGNITIKGLGMSDEIGGSVKKAFFAFRMSTYSGNKAMYTFVQAGQIHTDKLEQDEKTYNSVMNGVDISYKTLESIPFNNKTYNKIATSFFAPKKIPRKISSKERSIINGRYYDTIKNKLILQKIEPKIKKYSPLYFETQAFYAQFFRMSGVTKHSKIPIFNSREDLEKAVKQHNEELIKKYKHIETGTGFVKIGETEEGNAIKSTKDLIEAFLKKAEQAGLNISGIDLSKPLVQKEFYIFLQSMGDFNKHSYFDAVIDETLKYSNINQNEIFSQFFLYKSTIFFTKKHLEALVVNLRKAEFIEKKQDIKKTKEVFQEIPWDILKNKLGYPLSEAELFEISGRNAEKMRALILIWMRETAWGKEYLLKKRGKETSTLNNIMTFAMNTLDSAHANLTNTASAGRWQVKIPIIKPEIQNIKLNTNIVLEKTETLLKEINKLQKNKKNISLQSQEFLQDLKQLKTVLKNITKNNKKSYNILKSTLVRFYEKYPQAGAIMAISHMNTMYSSINTQLGNAKIKGEKISNRQVYNHIINSWSSPVADAQSLTVNILDDIVNKYKLTDVYKKIDKKTKALIEKKDGFLPNFLPNKILSMNDEIVGPSEKGKIRIIEMIKKIVEFLQKDTPETNNIKQKILDKIKYDIDGNTDEEKLKNFFKKVEFEMKTSENNPKSNALFLAQKSLESGNNISTKNTQFFTILFKALRETNKDISLKLNSDKITDLNRLQMGNYLGSSIDALNSLKTVQKNNNKMIHFLDQQEIFYSNKNEKITTEQIIMSLENIIKNKPDNFIINLKNKNSAKIIQQFLKDLKLYDGIIDGFFGVNSRKALNKISAIGNIKNKQLAKSDIQNIINFYKENIKKLETNLFNSIETTDIKIIENLKSKLNDEFLTKYPNKQIAIGVLKGFIFQIKNLEDKKFINKEKIQNLKNRVLQIQLKLMGYYKGEIDGGLGRNSSNAIQTFLADHPNLVLDDKYLIKILPLINKKS